VAASKARVVALKASLDAGAGLVCDSCHTAANAIKVWVGQSLLLCAPGTWACWFPGMCLEVLGASVHECVFVIVCASMCMCAYARGSLPQQWFRELPTALFNPMDPALMMLGEQGAAPALDSLAPVLRSTTLWLLDLLCTVADNEADTRMDAHNLGVCLCACGRGGERACCALLLLVPLVVAPRCSISLVCPVCVCACACGPAAIVFSPNLYVVSSENPMVVYSRSSEFTAFFEKVLQWRRASRGA
jgi:hypothetical protein